MGDRSWIALGVCALLVACSSETPSQGGGEPAGELEQAVNGGALTDDAALKPVVYVSLENGFLCSGTFVHPRYIMTAAHCTARCQNNQQAGCWNGAVSSPTENGAWGGRNGPLEPAFNGASDGLTPWTGNSYDIDAVYYVRSPSPEWGTSPPDMALLHTTAASPYTPIHVWDAFNLPRPDNVRNYAGTRGYIVGFSSNNDRVPQARRRGAVQVTGGTLRNGRAFETRGLQHGCSGDSGGPFLFTDGTRFFLGGVDSIGAAGCPTGSASNGFAFVTRSFLDERARADPTCASPWDECVTAAEGGLELWSSNFSDAGGWDTSEAYWATIGYPDVNGDGLADVCGRGAAGMWCGVSNGRGFSGPTLWTSQFSDADGWANSESHFRTFQYPDVNGDGKADVCARAVDGLACALSTGSSFGTARIWSTYFSDWNGLRDDPSRYMTIQFVHWNSDGKADLCARDPYGIVCSINDGEAFPWPSLWTAGFSNGNGWTSPDKYESIRLGDVNGDGIPDVCGRDEFGVWCATYSFPAFQSASLWTSEFGASFGSSPSYWKTLRYGDVDNDRRIDVCGRGPDGMKCGLSTGSGFAFTSALTIPSFSDANQWTFERTYSTISLVDVNGDGRSDVCGRHTSGWMCSLSLLFGEPRFALPKLRYPALSDDNFWFSPSYYRTLRPATVRAGAPVMCSRGRRGIYCSTVP